MTQPREFTPEETMFSTCHAALKVRDARWNELRKRLNTTHDAIADRLQRAPYQSTNTDRGEILGLLDALILMNDIEKEMP